MDRFPPSRLAFIFCGLWLSPFLGFLGFLLAVYGVVGDSTALVFFLLFAVPVLLTTAVGLLARRRPGEIFWFALISSVLTGLLLVLWFAVALSDFN